MASSYYFPSELESELVSESSVLYLWYSKKGSVFCMGGTVGQVIESAPLTRVWCPPKGAAGTLEKLPAPPGSDTYEGNFNLCMEVGSKQFLI
jgi:hypothetical protein